MKILTLFRNPREICYAIEKVCEPEIGQLTSRPWNMHDPDNSTWWIVPSSEWPAYKHGKFHFAWGDKERRTLFIGIYFEKGLDPSVSLVYSCARGLRNIMENDWTWFRLIRDLENNRIPQAVKSVASNLPIPLELTIDGGYVSDPCDFDSHAPKFSWDKYFFEWDNTSVRFDLKRASAEADLLGELKQFSRFEELPVILRNFNTNRWLWVNLHFGIRLQLHRDDLQNENFATWDASDCWANLLRGLSPWLI